VVHSLGGLGPNFAGGAGYILDGNETQVSKYYSTAVWSTDDYIRLKDLQWRLKGPLQGHVEVGEPQQASPASATQPRG